MTPEVQILLINAAGLALAYGLIYPRLTPLTMGRIALADLAMTGLLLALAALLHGQTRFWLFGLQTGPLVFAIVTLAALELPVFSWFAKKHDLRF